MILHSLSLSLDVIPYILLNFIDIKNIIDIYQSIILLFERVISGFVYWADECCLVRGCHISSKFRSSFASRVSDKYWHIE